MKTRALAAALIAAATCLAPIARAGTIPITPVGPTPYTALVWGPLNPDGNSINTPLGVVSTAAAGGTAYVPNSAIGGQGAVHGTDDLAIAFTDYTVTPNKTFSVNQILINFITANPNPSELLIGGETFAIPQGADYLDIYLPGITGFNFRTIATGPDGVNDFSLGTIYASNSTTALDGSLGFSTPIPEPGTFGLLAIASAPFLKKRTKKLLSLVAAICAIRTQR